MSTIGPGVSELRINDDGKHWRVIYRADPKDIVVAEVFLKKTNDTPENIKAACKKRYRHFDGG